MEEKQKEFLRLAVEEQLHYREIEVTLGVPRKVLSKWWEELKDEREKISQLHSLWKEKCDQLDYYDFKRWYLSAEKKCHYCGIKKEEIDLLWSSFPKLTKRKRGRILEIDRKKPEIPYNDTSNLVFCCYWCNNAKTDTFSEDEFLKVGEVIREIWKNRLDGTR